MTDPLTFALCRREPMFCDYVHIFLFLREVYVKYEPDDVRSSPKHSRIEVLSLAFLFILGILGELNYEIGKT